ncbi:hypothetical protein LIER_07404 [Lithospermum erythrorhizon]|uniref:MULE transposase domain-containing protein n=1 Tax=Lithospermum erythrorhizon TaxID=34254 RepID=A0AAV3P961_LITER
MVEEHTCESSMKIDMVKVKFLARKYVNKIRRNPKISLNFFIGDIYDDLKVEINVSTAWRAIKAVGYLLYGNENQQFVRLWSYAKELLDTMPGSTVITKLDEQKFMRIYICPEPLKRELFSGCRRFICVDGCFLKGAFNGQLLAAVAHDADNGIYPIAWAVVEVENTESWKWFIKLLKEDLHMDRQPKSWVLMTNQQNSELLDAEHRLCIKHLHAKWSKRFPKKMMKDLMWKAATAANVKYFKYRMQRIKNVSVDAYKALDGIERKK